MVALGMIVAEEGVDGRSERTLSEEDHAVERFVLDRPVEPLDVSNGVTVEMPDEESLEMFRILERGGYRVGAEIQHLEDKIQADEKKITISVIGCIVCSATGLLLLVLSLRIIKGEGMRSKQRTQQPQQLVGEICSSCGMQIVANCYSVSGSSLSGRGETMKRTMRLAWLLMVYSVFAGIDTVGAPFSEYFPLDPDVHGLKTFQWTFGRSGSFESYIAGSLLIPYRSGPVEATVITNFFAGEEPRGEEPLYATNNGVEVRWLGYGCNYIAKTCDLEEPAPGWLWPPVVEGGHHETGTWYGVRFCEPAECSTHDGGQEFLFDIQDVTVLYGQYDAAIIMWDLDTDPESNFHFTPVNFHGIDIHLGIIPPGIDDTGDHAITDFYIYGRGIGLIAFGGVDAESGDMVEFFELSSHSLTSGMFVRGDANADGRVDIGDAISVLGYLFGAVGDPSKTNVAQCLDAADANDDGKTDIADAIKILGHLFGGQGPLPEPFGECGADLTDDTQGCESCPLCENVPSFTLTLPGAVPLEMVWCPAGTFMMGRYAGERWSNVNEDWQHQVTLTQGFWLGKYEVTKRQWEAVMGTTPWAGMDYVLNDPDSPAVWLGWVHADTFVTAVNALGQGTFGLPTEAQWEYACRAGTTTRFYWGDDPVYAQMSRYAWHYDNALNGGGPYAHVVGQKLPNPWGLYDMSGNAWEWCQDWYEDQYSAEAVTDPTGPPIGPRRVRRGGSWVIGATLCRSAARERSETVAPYAEGFRIARISPP